MGDPSVSSKKVLTLNFPHKVNAASCGSTVGGIQLLLLRYLRASASCGLHFYSGIEHRSTSYGKQNLRMVKRFRLQAACVSPFLCCCSFGFHTHAGGWMNDESCRLRSRPLLATY